MRGIVYGYRFGKANLPPVECFEQARELLVLHEVFLEMTECLYGEEPRTSIQSLDECKH